MKKKAKDGLTVSISDSEAWLYRNREALDSVRRGLQDAADGKTKSLGSFARFAADDRQRQ